MGGDMLTIGVINDDATGQEYILEVNGTSSDLMPDCAEEDNYFVSDVVLDRMNEVLCESSGKRRAIGQ